MGESKTSFPRQDQCLGTRGHSQLLEDAGDVIAHRLFTDEQSVGDPLVVVTLGNLAKDF